jgi:hypothetical protein
MATPSQDLLTFLANMGFGIPGTNLFRLQEGDNAKIQGQRADPTTTIYPYGGEPPEMIQNSPNHPAIATTRHQIKVRSQDAGEAELKAWEIWDVLFLPNVVLQTNGDLAAYTLIQPLGEPGITDPPDANGRIAIGFNVRMRRK